MEHLAFLLLMNWKKTGLIYTGSDDHYYNITTSKIPMKMAFEKAGVSTAKWEIIDGS